MKVFWAWQFDLPGKISRHFIRGALEEAIKAINAIDGIDEPDENFQTACNSTMGEKASRAVPTLRSKFSRRSTGRRYSWVT